MRKRLAWGAAGALALLAACHDPEGKDPAGPARAADTLGVVSASQLVQLFDADAGPAGELQMAADRISSAANLPLAGDFDGDGLDSVGSFDAVSGEVRIRQDNAPGAPETVSFPLGAPVPGGFAIAGDFDGDGRDSVGIYEGESARFRLRSAPGPGAPEQDFTFGAPRLIPLAGDFDGDGVDTIGVYDPLTGEFALRNQSSAGPPDHLFRFGPAGCLPVVGDWDGDGIDTVGAFDLKTDEVHLRNALGAGPADRTLRLPAVGWGRWPVAGRWKPPAGAAWEGFAWPTAAPESQGLDPALLDGAFRQAAQMPDVFSVLVLRNGRLVREEYFHGAGRGHANNIKSVSKSLLSAVAGLASGEGKIVMTDKLARYLPEHFGVGTAPAKREIQLNHLITMTAGLRWTENDGALFTGWFGSADWVRFPLDQDLAAAPGTTFEYNTGLTHIMSAVLARATGATTRAYAERTLLGPLGIRAVRWDRDPGGTWFGGAEMYLVPRDLARFGELYLRRGALEGKRLLDPAWIDGTTRTLVPPALVDGVNGYGAWWWTRRFAAEDVYFAWGYGGQFIFVFPPKALVIVVTSRSDVDGARSGRNADLAFALVSTGILPALR